MKLFVLIWAAFASCALLHVNDKNFQEIVIDSGKFTLVDFYADWCRHCQNLMPTIKQLAETFADEPDIQIVKLNGDADGRKTTRKYDIPGFPMLMLFHGDDKPLEFEGIRDHDSISNFVRLAAGASTQSNYSVLEEFGHGSGAISFFNDENFQDKVLRANHKTIVLFTSSRENCKNINAIWNTLASTVYPHDQSVVRFGVVNLDEDNRANVAKLAGQFGVASTPRVLLFDPSKVHSDGLRRPSVYDGEMSSESLISFVNAIANLGRTADGTLSSIAGRISSLDKILATISDETQQTVFETIQKLEDDLQQLGRDALVESKALLVDDDVGMIAYYKKLANKLATGKDFASNEAGRLERILENHGKDLEQSAQQSMHKRLNILRNLVST